MPRSEFHRGDWVEVRGPSEILATLDEQGDLEGLPFMPEMAAYCHRRFQVTARADKVCDTVRFSGSRRLPDSVLLDDLRCDGSGHGGCQADCRFFWKEAWLRKVAPGAPPPPSFPESERARLIARVSRAVRPDGGSDGQDGTRYRCQATEVPHCSEHLRTFDPRPYLRELTSGNVSLGRFVRVMARAVVEEPQRKLGFYPDVFLSGNAPRGESFEKLDLQVGEWVRVKSKEEIARTLNAKGMNRGLRFDREMLPFCGRLMRVRSRVDRFIDEYKGVMVVMKNDAILLDGAVCEGDLNPGRWFCPRAIYAFWRECWLERAEAPAVAPSFDRQTAISSGSRAVSSLLLPALVLSMLALGALASPVGPDAEAVVPIVRRTLPSSRRPGHPCPPVARSGPGFARATNSPLPWGRTPFTLWSRRGKGRSAPWHPRPTPRAAQGRSTVPPARRAPSSSLWVH